VEESDVVNLFYAMIGHLDSQIAKENLAELRSGIRAIVEFVRSRYIDGSIDADLHRNLTTSLRHSVWNSLYYEFEKLELHDAR
jgi:hypothetical protein